MVLDKRMPEDTLWLILEEDFRFWPQGEDTDGSDDYKVRMKEVMKRRKRSRSRNKIPKGRGSVAHELPAETAASSSHDGAYRPSDVNGKGKTNNVVTQHHYTPVRGRTDQDVPNDGMSSNVADIIRMATMCHRQKMGDLIWYGWASQTALPSWLSHGSTAIGLTKKGAREISAAMDEGRVERGHIDLVLLSWLQTPGEAAAAQACYIYPSVGAFFEHPSGCDPHNFGEAQGGRPAGWGTKSASKGTRVKHDDDKGHMGEICFAVEGGDA